MWAEKYRPETLREVVAQELAAKLLEEFIKDFKKQDRKAVLIYSPCGTGKNSLVYTLAKELDCEIIEFNASKLRDKDSIKTILKPATQQHSLFGKGNIIFIDEADAFTGLDRGGLAAVISLLEETKWPIIFTANNLWDKKLNELRRRVLQIPLNKLNYMDISTILRKICEREGLRVDKEVCEAIAIKARGDARAAINDLQSLAFLDKIDEKYIASLGEREKEESIFNALALIFKSTKAEDALGAFDNVNLPLDECILWLDENLPLEYSGKELEEAYQRLSKADIFRRRIIRRQHWRFLVYIAALATAGITAAKSGEKKKYITYKRLSRLLKIWMAKQKNMRRKELAKKIGKATHSSQRKIYRELPLFEMIFRNSSEEELAAFSRNLRLDEEELSYIRSLRKL